MAWHVFHVRKVALYFGLMWLWQAAYLWERGGEFAAMVQALFAMAKLSVEVMVLLFGTLTLWLGFLRIAEEAGVVRWLARALGPLFARLMPEVPRLFHRYLALRSDQALEERLHNLTALMHRLVAVMALACTLGIGLAGLLIWTALH